MAYSESASSFTAVDFEYGDLFALMQRNECHISAVRSPLLVTTSTLSTNCIPHTHTHAHTHTLVPDWIFTAVTLATWETFFIQSIKSSLQWILLFLADNRRGTGEGGFQIFINLSFRVQLLMFFRSICLLRIKLIVNEVLCNSRKITHIFWKCY